MKQRGKQQGKRWLWVGAGILIALAGLLVGSGLPALAQGSGEQPGQTIPPDATPLFLPAISNFVAGPTPTPTVPARVYGQVTVKGGSFGGPAQSSPDANLGVRGYTATVAYLGLVNYDGDTDAQAPQIAGMFTPPRLPGFAAAYQVYDWNWACNPPAGCLGQPITEYPVTLLAMTTTVGEALAIPSRGPTIAAGTDYRAMVVYAEPTRISFVYTDRDTPTIGYLFHLEGLAVTPELVALYQQLDAAGRKQLPALRNGEVLGFAAGETVKIATRDTGSFLDPRACKDWWQDYMSQCTVRLARPASAWRLPGR